MGFLVPLIAGASFAATALGGAIATGLNIVATVGLSVVAGALTKKTASGGGSVGGLETSITVDADVPRSLVVGRTVVAGSLAYAGTSQSYGRPGSLEYRENVLLTEIIALADHPIEGFDEIWIDGEKSGYPLPEPNAFANATIGRNINCDLYDGRQTSADPVAQGLYANTENPWPATAVGHGIAYARVSALYQANVLDGVPTFKFVIRGARLYDPRFDSSVGGSGGQRFDDLDTHGYTANPIVIIYNILRGIRVRDGDGVARHFYGLESVSAEDLPLDVWFAAMNACDEAVDNGDGTSGPRFVAGGEIPVDTAPMDAVDALLASCNGKRCEIGGIHEVFVGAPGAPVLTFDDDDLLTTEDVFDLLMPQQDRVNEVAASYVDPRTWERADAPLRRSDDYLAADGRRLTGNLTLDMVTSLPQVQRIQIETLEESRRQRRHSVPLPPWAMVARPGRVVRWTSARNGYDAKLFRVDGWKLAANLDVALQITELDPADYDWDPDFFLPPVDGTFISLPPTPRGVGGFQAEGAIWRGANGQQRPAILLTWDEPGSDVDRIVIEARRRVDSGQETEPRVSDICSDPAAMAFFFVRDLSRLTWYQVRARPDGVNGWEGEWSLWIDVQTPNVGLVDLDALGAELAAKIALIDAEGDASIALAEDVIDRLHAEAATRGEGFWRTETLRQETDAKDGALHVTVTEEIAVAKGEALAAVASETSLRVTADSALATQIDVVTASVADVAADVVTEAIARAAADSAQATLITQAQATANEGTATSRVMLDAVSGPGGPQSRIRMLARANGIGGYVQTGLYIDTDSGGLMVLEAAKTAIMSSSGTVAAYFDASGKVAKAYIPTITSDMITTGVLIADSAQIGSLVVGTANIANQAVVQRYSAVVDSIAAHSVGWSTIATVSASASDDHAVIIQVDMVCIYVSTGVIASQYALDIDGSNDVTQELAWTDPSAKFNYATTKIRSAGSISVSVRFYAGASGYWHRKVNLSVLVVRK